MQVTDLTKEEIIKECDNLIGHDKGSNIVTLNSLMLRRAWRNRKLYSAIENANLVTADSVGICLASLLLDARKVCRYPGIEMMEDLIDRGWKFFFLGSRGSIAEKAANMIKRKIPNARLAGTHHGYFGKEEETKIISHINNCQPDVLFVGMSIPYQEIWIDRNKDKIKTKLIIGVGGSFDVISEELMRAPYFFRISGIEWLWRLIIQPWRITRIIKLPLFVFDIFWRYFRRKPLISRHN